MSELGETVIAQRLLSLAPPVVSASVYKENYEYS